MSATVTNLQPIATNTATAFSTFIANRKTVGSDSEKGLISKLEKYVSDMQPGKPLVAVDAGRNNFILYQAIVTIGRCDDFHQQWITLLKFFAEYRSASLGAQYTNRYSYAFGGKTAEYNNYVKLTTLLQMSCLVNDYKVFLRQYNIINVVTGLTADFQQKIIGFYSN